MWSIANTTPYVVGAEILRDRQGAETLVLVVKATFLVSVNGECAIAPDQVDIARVPQFSREPGQSSLVTDTEFVPAKPRTDVLLLGHAFAPRGTRVVSVDVALQVGELRNEFRVWGDRQWRRGSLRWSATEPTPFERMPIVYERAYGGTHGKPDANGVLRCDPRNPVGRGFDTEARADGDLLPNIEYVNETRRPAGFGPIARHWEPRVKFAGTYDDDWRRHRHPLVPTDFDDLFYQTAPLEQQSAVPLTGGEPVILRNLTPSGLLQFKLPRIPLLAHVDLGDDVAAQRPKLHTVLIEPDVPRVVMTWSSALRCQGRALKIGDIHVRQKPMTPLGTRPGQMSTASRA